MLDSEKEKMVTDNLKLVHHLINRMYPTYSHDEDLIQAGNLGLVKAANTYDPTKGTLFSTYACYCILNEFKIEFRTRSKHFGVQSLDYLIHDDNGHEIPRMETLVGDEDIDLNAYNLGEFVKSLSDKEQKLVKLLATHSMPQVAKILNVSPQAIQQKRRRLLTRWEKFNEDK